LRCGLGVLDEDPALIANAGFLGGGMARMGQVCGALSGAAVLLGLRERLLVERGEKPVVTTFDWLQELPRVRGRVRAVHATFLAATSAGEVSVGEGSSHQTLPEFVDDCDRLVSSSRQDWSAG
jgi:hypothetical protein